MLSKKVNTEVEERILSAVRWAGRATAERRRDVAFLLFAIALEALLTGPNNRGDVTYKTCLRAAHLCANDDLASRKLYYDRMDRLYNLRSKIVHAGHVGITAMDLAEMCNVAKSAIVLVLTRDQFHAMEAHKTFNRWFEDRVLE